MINVFSRLSVFVAAFFLIVIVGCQTNGPIAVKGAGTGNGQLTDHTVLFVDEGPSGISEARRLGQTFPSSDFVATGLYLAPGDEVTVDVSFTRQGSGTPRLLIGTYSRYEEKWNPTEVELIRGTQTVSGRGKGGLLYIRYHTENGEEPGGQVRLEFKSGALKVPHFKLGETDHRDWQHQLEKRKKAPDVILESNHAMIVVSREHALEFRNEDQADLLTLLDRVMDAEAEISGLTNSGGIHQRNRHKVLLTETDMEDTYMAATWYRTWYHKDAIRHILTTNGLQHDGWGPWHEIGHMHQQDAWTWQGLGEVTVNIYSLAAERVLGNGRSRLARDHVWAEVALYLNLPDSERDFNSEETNYFVRLAMYQQLWIAFGDEFYQKLHRRTREGTPGLENREDKMRYFMLQATEISGVDLGDFFRRWGLRVDESVYSEIASKGLSLPGQDLTKLTDDPNFIFPDEPWAEVIDFSSEETSKEGKINGRAERLVDGMKGTYWHSAWEETIEEFPHHLIFRILKPQEVRGFEFTQRANGARHVREIEILVSSDNLKWESMGTFELDSVTTPQKVSLPARKKIAYFKVIMKSAYDGESYAAMDEIRIY